jgi:hypothetical protein
MLIMANAWFLPEGNAFKDQVLGGGSWHMGK